ncbi:hypothetical protein HG530_003487 [Fusarium avenaceum]|nr:hypothetical protein HG530_003487 [Fusarium avenaceum]
MLLNTSTQSDLLANVGTGGASKNKLGSIVLDGSNLGSGRGGTNVDHDNLVLGQLRNLGLLSVGGPHTEQTAEKVEVDLNLAGRINSGTDTNETTRNGVLEIVGLGVEGDDSAEDGSALEGTAVVSGDDTRSDLDLVTQLNDTMENGTTSNTTLEVVDLRTRFVDIERSNDDHVRVNAEISGRDGDGVDNGLVDGIDVELELSRDGDDGGFASNCSSDKLEDRLVVLLSSIFPHKIDLVLENNDLVELHDLDGSQMLRGLRLRAGFVTGDEEEGGVHDGGT